MRDYFEVWIHSFESPTLGILNRWFSTQEEAESFFPGGDWVSEGPSEVRYLLLFKDGMLFALNSDANFGNSAPLEFETPRYGIGGTKDNPTYAETDWPSNDGDPRNPTAEAQTKAKGSQAKFTLAQLIQQAMSRLLSIGSSRALLCASQLGQILGALLGKKISEATAAERFDEVVAAFPDLFGNFG